MQKSLWASKEFCFGKIPAERVADLISFFSEDPTLTWILSAKAMQCGHTDLCASINYLPTEQLSNHGQEKLLWVLGTPEEVQPFTFTLYQWCFCEVQQRLKAGFISTTSLQHSIFLKNVLELVLGRQTRAFLDLTWDNNVFLLKSKMKRDSQLNKISRLIQETDFDWITPKDKKVFLNIEFWSPFWNFPMRKHCFKLVNGNSTKV